MLLMLHGHAGLLLLLHHRLCLCLHLLLLLLLHHRGVLLLSRRLGRCVMRRAVPVPASGPSTGSGTSVVSAVLRRVVLRRGDRVWRWKATARGPGGGHRARNTAAGQRCACPRIPHATCTHARRYTRTQIHTHARTHTPTRTHAHAALRSTHAPEPWSTSRRAEARRGTVAAMTAPITDESPPTDPAREEACDPASDGTRPRAAAVPAAALWQVQRRGAR